MSTIAPQLNGTTLATAEEVAALRQEVEELRQNFRALNATPPRTWREALAVSQAGMASMTEEERKMYEEAVQEARALVRQRSVDGE